MEKQEYAKGKNKLLSARDLCKTYGEGSVVTKAVDGVDLDIYEGEMLVIIGNSGSGKSTLLNLIGGMDTPDAGEIIIGGRDICRLDDKELTDYRMKEVGFVFQSFNLISDLKASENVRLTADTKKDPDIVNKVFETVGMTDKIDRYPSQLSGGEQQRVAIARALAGSYSFILCDEPTGALDYETGKQILSELEKLVRRDGKTIVIVTHTREIGNMADRVIVMKNGRIIQETVNEYPVAVEEIEW